MIYILLMIYWGLAARGRITSVLLLFIKHVVRVTCTLYAYTEVPQADMHHFPLFILQQNDVIITVSNTDSR